MERDSESHVGEARGHELSLSRPQWLHLSRANVRGLAMSHEALCILAPP